MSRSPADILQDLENLTVEIIDVVDPNASNIVQDAIDTVTGLLIAKTLTTAQAVSDVDDSAEAALKSKLGK